jgi:hypoxanthine phosphoribosyltransferase
MSNKKYLSYGDIHILTEQVAVQLKNWNDKFDCIVAAARGGLMPAQIVGYFLQVPKIYSLGITTYSDDDKKLDSPHVYQPLPDDFSYNNVLLIDEIADSGHTFVHMTEILEEKGVDNITTASLIVKKGSSFIPTVHGQFVGDEWIVFPYDR